MEPALKPAKRQVFQPTSNPLEVRQRLAAPEGRRGHLAPLPIAPTKTSPRCTAAAAVSVCSTLSRLWPTAGRALVRRESWSVTNLLVAAGWPTVPASAAFSLADGSLLLEWVA